VRTVRGTGLNEPRLLDAITTAGGIVERTQPPTVDEVASLVADVARSGDATRGEEIFRRADLQCLNCHAIAGAGGQVGPSLESIGASAPVDYLIESLLAPAKAVKENYHATVVATTDGQVVTGIKIRQTDDGLVLRDAEDREISLPLESIEEQKPGGSLMPAALTDSLTRGELVDLVRFLSELGKVGAFAVGSEQVVRRWRVLAPGHEAGMALQSSRVGQVPDGPSLRWTPAYSRVSGELPLDALPRIRLGSGGPVFGVARASVEVSTPGRFRLELGAAEGLDVWIDEAHIEPRESIAVDLARGAHTITIAARLDTRSGGLRCALKEAAGSDAQARIVVGK
jgi:putative heme-binding domain-containing protein